MSTPSTETTVSSNLIAPRVSVPTLTQQTLGTHASHPRAITPNREYCPWSANVIVSVGPATVLRSHQIRLTGTRGVLVIGGLSLSQHHDVASCAIDPHSQRMLASDGFSQLSMYRAFQAWSIAKLFGIPFHLSPEIIAGLMKTSCHTPSSGGSGRVPARDRAARGADEETRLLCAVGFWWSERYAGKCARRLLPYRQIAKGKMESFCVRDWSSWSNAIRSSAEGAACPSTRSSSKQSRRYSRG